MEVKWRNEISNREVVKHSRKINAKYEIKIVLVMWLEERKVIV